MTQKTKFHPFLILIIVLLTIIPSCNLPVTFLSRQTATPTSTSEPIIPSTPTPTPTPPPTDTPLPETRISSGQSALNMGDWMAAEAEFNTVLQDSSEIEQKLFAQLGKVKTSLFKGEVESAIDLATQLITETISYDPSIDLLSEAYFILGNAYSVNERFIESADAYSNYLTLKPGVIDSYIQDLRGEALFSGGAYMQAAEAFNASLQSASLLDRVFIKMKLARALALAGDSNTALNAYDEIFQETDNDYTKALIHLRKGQIYQSIGQTEQANNEFLTTVNNYPTANDSYQALLYLVESNIEVDELKRGLVDYYAGEYGVALAAFDRYLNNQPSDPGTALYYSGLAHQSGGRYDQAILTWDKMIQNYPDHPYWDDSWEQKGFTQWFYLDDFGSAVETFQQFTITSPTHPRAAEFLDDAARVAERSDDLEKAAALWKSVTMQFPNDERAVYTLFLSGISQYRLGKFRDAMDSFAGTLGISQTLSDKARAYLWIGKANQALGNLEEAKKAWQDGATVDPTGYYSERSRDLLMGRLPFSPPGMLDFGSDNNTELMQALAWMNNEFTFEENRELSDLSEFSNEPAFLRAEELWRLGLLDDARLEFESLRQAALYDPVLTFKLTRLFSEIGLYRSAAFTSRHILDLAGLDDASSLTAPPYFNKIRFPVHYSDIIMPVAVDYGIQPLLILSVIRQESLFESFVQSSAAARGLMQIIPSTGAEVAEKLGWPENFTSQDLNRPVVNINLGTAYLAEQLERFDGDIYTALAAYNGGPGNASQWLSLANGDQDLFLEVIRYPETREYIRRIYEVFSIYRRLYERTP